MTATTDAQPRVLVVDDEAPIRKFLRIALGAEGYAITEAERGRTAVEAAAVGAPDIIILDLGLPDMDGKAVVQAIREWSDVPILVLSVRDSETEKIAALDAGADDYVTKPFAAGELLARMRALRRKKRTASETTTWTANDLVVDLGRRLITKAGDDVKLTRKEFDVLALLVRHAGRLVTHKQMLRSVWGPAHEADAHYLRIVIGKLREKLSDDADQQRLIITEPGVGYRLATEA